MRNNIYSRLSFNFIEHYYLSIWNLFAASCYTLRYAVQLVMAMIVTISSVFNTFFIITINWKSNLAPLKKKFILLEIYLLLSKLLIGATK